ncbi:HPP family protein [Streptomyces sp. NPDC002779]|uniref:HPP family protein n=1 Tax=Streptomyces sp. NPDC002779 TaxID=3364664 RepID=UPI00367AC548
MTTDSAINGNGIIDDKAATLAMTGTGQARSRAAWWPASKAPQRPGVIGISVATAFAVVAMLVLVSGGSLIGQTLLIPPLAASGALVFGAPSLPLAQPRSVVGGQLLSACTGFVVLAVGGGSMTSAAVAGGLALGVMMAARTPHSPAAATAVIVVLMQPSALSFLPLLALASVLLVGVGMVAGRSRGGARYPSYWW